MRACELEHAVQMSGVSTRDRKWALHFIPPFKGWVTLQVCLAIRCLLTPSLSVCPWKGSTVTDKNPTTGYYRETVRPGQEE